MSDLTEPQLRTLVEAFYATIRQDAALGPIFNDIIEDWPEHLDKLTAFWSGVMLGSGRYSGNPMAKHVAIRARLSPALLSRWLSLWGETAARLLPPEPAAAIKATAQRIAHNLQRGCGLLENI
ncbi:group III truncated hemoglobin [Acidocella sp.]|uniref:group III truncated hemoglobin n=1 Tax=Acidocella sp. TaxID=50710 RepID=UPI00262F8D2B|nr:group III truncated hemoglobin [Acidocella sp.]